MTEDLRISPEGVKLLNLNWGYQIIHHSQVLKAFFDEQKGPHRSSACTAEAELAYARICDLYQRLYANKPKPTERTVYTLGRIIKAEDVRVRHGNSITALFNRGVIRRKLSGDYYDCWEPIFGEGL